MIKTLCFYSGYQYASQVDQFIKSIEPAIQKCNRLPCLIDSTALQVIHYQRLQANPFDALKAQELALQAAKQNLDQSTASLGWLARKVVKCVQTLVFYLLGAHRLDAKSWIEGRSEPVPFIAKLKQRVKLALQQSCGYRIATREIGLQITHIYVLFLVDDQMTKITLKQNDSTASIEVKNFEDVQRNRTILCKQFQPSSHRQLDRVLLNILTELALRESKIAHLIYVGDLPDLFRAAGFRSNGRPQEAVLCPGALRHPHLTSPYLPGDGPFLPYL